MTFTVEYAKQNGRTKQERGGEHEATSHIRCGLFRRRGTIDPMGGRAEPEGEVVECVRCGRWPVRHAHDCFEEGGSG